MDETRAARLRQAEEFLDDADFLSTEQIWNLQTLTKLYHAMLYSLFALFDLRDIGNLTHKDIIERFQREWVRTGVFGKEFLDALFFAYEYTHECDCLHRKQPSDEAIERILPTAKEFVGKVREHLEANAE